MKKGIRFAHFTSDFDSKVNTELTWHSYRKGACTAIGHPPASLELQIHMEAIRLNTVALNKAFWRFLGAA